MALDSYTALLAALPDWMMRDDLVGASVIADCVTLAEAQINRRLKDAKLTGRATATLSDEYSAVPDDFGGVVSFALQTDPKTDLAVYSAPELAELAAGRYRAAGKPLAVAVVGSEFRFSPVPDGAYTADLTYYQRVPALSSDNPTNWLLTRHPDVYLYGALTQSAPYLRADKRLPMWASLFTTAIDDLIAEVERDKYGARPARRMRSFG